MPTLLLVRHGQTDWNVEGRWQGQADAPMNDKGRAQARALADQLNGWRVDAIWSSDLQRALETAQIIADRQGKPVHADRRLREINLGRWEGMLVTDIKQRYPQEWAERRRDVRNSRAPGGESVAEVAERVQRAADDVARQWPAGRVLLVSHGVSLAALICQSRGVTLEEVYHYVPDNGDVIEIEWPPEATTG